MERLKLVSLALFGANLFLWNFQGEGVRETPEDMKAKIEAIEREIPDLEKTAQWVEQVEGVLQDPPGGEPNALLQDLVTLGQTHGVTLHQTSVMGGEPPRVQFAGTGPYAGFGALATELEKRTCVQVEKLGLTKMDDGQVEVTCEALVRNGGWEGQGVDDNRPDPFIPPPDPVTIGGVDVFNRQAPAAPETAPRVLVRYLGFHSGKAGATLILEVERKSIVVGVGEKFSRGMKVVSADNAKVRIRSAKGEEWSVSMERPK